MRFADPWVLFFIILVPLLVFLSLKFGKKTRSTLRFSDTSTLENISPSFKIKAAGYMVYVRAVALLLAVIALARPQAVIEHTRVFTEGVDIVLAVDASSSMYAMDFRIRGERVNRLHAVKEVVQEFIARRKSDRIALIAFAKFAYTVCPLTLDHDWLEKNLERVNIGMIEDGTAVGSSITGALNRLKDSPTKEKIIILLTDGRNNAGRVSPLAAAEAAKALGVRIYTIGAGTKGLAPYPVKDMFGSTVLQPIEIEMDEKLLKKIADVTGGEYYRATDTDELKDIYRKIDKLEKTEMEEEGYNQYRELFVYVLIPAFLLLLFEILLADTSLRRIP